MIAHMGFAWLLFALVFCHVLADYPLQGDFLARAKDRHSDLAKVFDWRHALLAHSMIHAGFVALVTGSLSLAMAELSIHALTDMLKCERIISLNTDQAVHIACKVAWAAITVWSMA